MSKQIIWSPLSATDFENTLDYLNENWNEKLALSYITNIENLLLTISK